MPPQNIDRVYTLGATNNGVLMLCCGLAIVAMPIGIVSVRTKDDATSTTIVITEGFWCGLPLIITGAWGIHAGIKRTRDTMVAFMIPCIITFFTTTLQTINAGLQYKQLKATMRLLTALHHRGGHVCSPADKEMCHDLEIIMFCFLGLLFARIIGTVTSLVAAIISVSFYRKPLQEHPIHLGQGTPSSVQQPLNCEQGSCSQQPNTPQIETTRDYALLTA